MPGGGRLGERLVDASVVHRLDVLTALAAQPGTGTRLGTLLIQRRAIDERTLVIVLGAQLGIPLVDLRTRRPHPDAVRLLPEALARRFGAIALCRQDQILEVAVAAAALTDDLRAELEEAVATPVRLLLSSSYDVRRALDSVYRPPGPAHR